MNRNARRGAIRTTAVVRADKPHKPCLPSFGGFISPPGQVPPDNDEPDDDDDTAPAAGVPGGSS